jgi:hypothetical protein
MGSAWLRMVVEHHGGPRRLARFSLRIRPRGAILGAQGILGALAIASAALGLGAAAVGSGGLLALLWVAAVREASRLESGIVAAADEVTARGDAPGETPN